MTATTPAATYITRWGRVWGRHPVIIRTADGLMMPCTHTAPYRGEPVCPLPRDWRRDGDRRATYCKPLGAGRFDTFGTAAAVTDAALVAAADAAFAIADERAARRTARRAARRTAPVARPAAPAVRPAPPAAVAPALFAPAPTGRARRTIRMY